MNAMLRLTLVSTLLAVSTAPIARAEEMVTIPKARLEELERKEAELERLRRQMQEARAEKERLEREREQLSRKTAELEQARQAAEQRAAAASAAAATGQSIPTHTSPPIASLPPLEKGAVVDAMDLANHYRTEAAAAARRYESGPIHVKGQIARFEKPPFLRHYVIYLKAADAEWKVAARVYPPDSYAAVFPARGGEELVATTSAGARFVIARLGESVLLRGRCKGARDRTVWLGDATLLGRAE
jgi:hypothetical protein